MRLSGRASTQPAAAPTRMATAWGPMSIASADAPKARAHSAIIGPHGSSTGDNQRYPKTPPRIIHASQGSGGAAVALAPCLGNGLNNSAVRAGLKVSELNAEMIVETAIVRANW